MNITILILGAIGIGVYLDAVRHHIGKGPGKGGFLNIHAGGGHLLSFGFLSSDSRHT